MKKETYNSKYRSPMKKEKNPFIFMFICAAMSAIMYCIAFHEERDENKELKKQIEILKSKEHEKRSDN